MASSVAARQERWGTRQRRQQAVLQGLNPILFDLASEKHGFSSKWWATFNQWKALGGRVMPRPDHVPAGKWGTQIVFWSPVTKKVENDQGDLEDDRFFVLRLYTVFNVDQVEGLDHLRAGQPDTGEPLVIDYQPAEDAIVGNWWRTSDSAAARRSTARLATTSRFHPRRPSSALDEFYGTCFHELCHWTEHPSRLNWSRKEKENTYALGELVAEIGSCYVCRELGVPASDNLTNHIAYLGNWLQAMRNDPRFIFMASAQASKAADFILSFSRKPEDVPVPEDELVTA